jgi:predicted DNA binding CopG/RHH family protein
MKRNQPTRKTLEERVLADYDAGHLRSTKPDAATLQQFRSVAQATLLKDRRINIRITSAVLNRIQAHAAREGIPYQTLIASILHKFATGQLVEKGSR